MDLRPSLDVALSAFGLPAEVTLEDSSTVSTTAFWLPPRTVEVPIGGDLRRAETQRVLVLPLADVPQIQRGTVISVPEYADADAQSWRVDGVERVGHDHYRCLVMPVDPS